MDDGAPSDGGDAPEAAFVGFHAAKLSVAAYEARRDRTTRQQLNHLLASKEYRSWVQRSARPLASWRLEAAVALLGVCLGALLFALPFWGGRLEAPAPAEIVTTGATFEGEAATGAAESAARAAQELGARLQAKEAELSAQLERNAQLELSLWASEHELQTLTTARPTLMELLLPEGPGANLPVARPTSMQDALWGLPFALAAGALVLLATAAALCTLVVVRRRAAAAQAEAQRLQREIASAMQAQAAAEQQVAGSEAAMAGKAAELKAAAAAQRVAEAQVADLQQRVLELQMQAPPSLSGSPVLQGASAELQRAMAEELEDLHAAISDRDQELLALNRELGELADRLPREVQEREEAVGQVRRWLDQAQGQLQHTQTALNVKESECRQLEEQLAAQKAASVALEEALAAAQGREVALEAARAAAAAEMQARVASVMDLMKTTRLSLSQKLLHSQSTCEALAQELAARDASGRGEAADVLRESHESSASFEGFVVRKAASPKAKPAASRGSGGENAEPRRASQQFVSHSFGADSGKRSRSPYWFARGK